MTAPRAAMVTGASRGVGKNGRGDWIRTSDPHTPSVMRYQAALRPDQRRRCRRGAK